MFRRILLSLLTTVLISAFGASAFAEKQGNNGNPNIVINAVGDIMLGSRLPQPALPPEDGAVLFRFSKEYLNKGNPDIIFGNLEGAITDHSQSPKSPRVFAFQMPPSYTRWLKDAGFNVMSTANNHAFDFGMQGYRDTRRYLREAGIKYCGEKGEVVTMEIKGRKVAVVGFGWTDYFNNILRIEESAKFIREMKQTHDIVVVTFHGGTEGRGARNVRDEMEMFYNSRRGNLVRFSRAMIDAGADLIIGHGPHIPRSMEIYKDRLIAYSLGNFVTYVVFRSTPPNNYSQVLNVELDSEGRFVTGQVIPMIQYETGQYKGIPKYDPEGRTIKYMQEVMKEDFPGNPIRLGDDGVISVGK